MEEKEDDRLCKETVLLSHSREVSERLPASRFIYTIFLTRLSSIISRSKLIKVGRRVKRPGDTLCKNALDAVTLQ